MGIDIYASWAGKTEQEKRAQYTGFSIAHGEVGYLREAYHGGPYATRVLVPESFDDTLWLGSDEEGYFGAEISADVLESRLKAALDATAERYRGESDVTAMAQKSLRDFVALCREKEKQTGKLCRIYASY